MRSFAASCGAAAYQSYLRNQVLPFVDSSFRTEPSRRFLLGHSFGGLLAARILFTEPEMFAGYGLDSPSLWFDKRHAFRMEADYAAGHKDLPAQVFMYVGDFERPGPSRRNTRDVDMVADVKAMEDALRARNYPGLIVRSAILEDEDHSSVAPRGFTLALIDLLQAQQRRR